MDDRVFYYSSQLDCPDEEYARYVAWQDAITSNRKPDARNCNATMEHIGCAIYWVSLFAIGVITLLALSAINYADAQTQAEEIHTIEPIEVQDTTLEYKSNYSSPSVEVSGEQVQLYNSPTIDDAIKYEPNLIVRRRFIGDPNATLGIRGANMFQTTRSMVFADGLPLHYLLQSRFSGAPRWSLAAPDEVDLVEVVYGPFNAEYSGNAMGGVVNIKTQLPQEEQVHAEASYFSQSFEFLGTDKTVDGNREFISYGNKFDDLSVYFFYNRLENEGQPQSFRFDRNFDAPAGEPVVSGAVKAKDERGRDVIFFADSGVEEVETNLLKLKLGYDINSDLRAIMTVAYEDREREATPNNYLRDANDKPVWGDLDGDTNDAVFNGEAFNVRADRFGVSESNRETLLFGLHLDGKVYEQWNVDTTISYFDVLDDKTITSSRSPADPDNDNSGEIKEFGDTGWITYDLKFTHPQFLGRDDLSMTAGYHYDQYELEIQEFDSENIKAGIKDGPGDASGGKTRTHAIFGQLAWQFLVDWDATVGLRYEDWQAKDGFLGDIGSLGANHPDRDTSKTSPKFSLGYAPGQWTYRYSIAKAYRFPIVEELFKNVDSFNSESISNPGLKPEDGVHHNLLVQVDFDNGYARVNLFRDDIEDTIFNHKQLIDSKEITTFLPIDKVETQGIEFSLRQDRLFESRLDMQLNVTYMDAEITELKADPSVEGNTFPRLPKWRANLFTTYHINNAWDLSLGGRYQSDPFGRLDNEDREKETFGAQDEFFFVNFKTTYHPGFMDSRISLGIDNLTDEKAFVFHPYPQRTFFVEAAISL